MAALSDETDLILREPQASEILLFAARYCMGRSLTNRDGCALIRDHWPRLSRYRDSITHDLAHVAEHGSWPDVRKEARRTLDWIERHSSPPGPVTP